MTTKKQKRQAAIDKHNALLEERRRSGLEAQQKDRDYRRHQELAAWQQNHDKNHGTKKKLIKECPHCQEILKAQSRAARLAKEEEEAQAPKPDLSRPQTSAPPIDDEEFGPTRDFELSQSFAR